MPFVFSSDTIPLIQSACYRWNNLNTECAAALMVQEADTTDHQTDDGILNDENNFYIDASAHEFPDSSATTPTPIEPHVFFFGRDLNITKSQLHIICLLCPYFFLTSSYYSLFAPFFPNEALKKEISQTQVCKPVDRIRELSVVF